MKSTNNGPGTQNNYNGPHHNINHGNTQNNNTGSGQFFVQKIDSINMAAPDAHKTLWDAVAAVGASHRTSQQSTRGSCLDGTREEVLRIIRDWRVARVQGPPICWLSGAAGVGKTAIAMTVAESCEEEGLVCSFFFFRNDPERNNPSALMLTIAHDLTVAIPMLRNIINQRVSNDPRILKAIMEIQFRELVLGPSLDRGWRRRMRDVAADLSLATREPNLVIIDGLDECSDDVTQRRILTAIADCYRQYPRSPLRFLICSRPESWIRQAFLTQPLLNITKTIALDDISSAEDIRWYLVHEFRGIRSEDPHVPFPEGWPSKEDLAWLVRRSDGQFVYVKTAVMFVKLPGLHPVDQLRIIIDNTPDHPWPRSPFHELDSLYHIVLRSNPDHSKNLIFAILAAIVVIPLHLKFRPSPEFLDLLFGLTPGDVLYKLRAMHSVLDIRGFQDEIRVHHTSFTDYLFDRTRSREFYVDETKTQNSLALLWLQALSRSKTGHYRLDQLYAHPTILFFTSCMDFCVSLPKPSPELLDSLWNLDIGALFFCSVVASWSQSGKRSRWDCHTGFEEMALWLESKMDPVNPVLINRFRKHPKILHLEVASDTPPPFYQVTDPDQVKQMMDLATLNIPWSKSLHSLFSEFPAQTPLGLRVPQPLRITGCYCRDSRAMVSHSTFCHFNWRDYHDACLRTAETLTSASLKLGGDVESEPLAELKLKIDALLASTPS